jgi:hypothetical protein
MTLLFQGLRYSYIPLLSFVLIPLAHSSSLICEGLETKHGKHLWAFWRETQRDHGMTCMEWVLLYFNECSVEVLVSYGQVCSDIVIMND